MSNQVVLKGTLLAFAATMLCGTVRGTPLLDIPRGLAHWCEGIPLENEAAGASK